MRAEKVQMLNVVKELLQDKPVFIIGFNALTVAEFSEFRAKLAVLGAEVHVVKNTMITKAAEALGYEALAAQKLSLASAVVSGDADPVALAKAVKELSKTAIAEDKSPKVTIKLGWLDGQLLSGADVVALADLPPREALLGQLLGLLQAPAGQLVRVLNAKLSSVVYVLNAFLQKKEQAA